MSHDAVMTGDEGDFYLEADAMRELSFEDNSLAGLTEAYRCRYRVYYCAKKGMFYTAFDALLPIYGQALQSETAYVKQWAQKRLDNIDEARAAAAQRSE